MNLERLSLLPEHLDPLPEHLDPVSEHLDPLAEHLDPLQEPKKHFLVLVLKNLIAVHAIRFFFALDIALRLSYGINDSAIIAAVPEHR